MASGTEPDWAPTPEFWAGRRVGVTGATGFLGAHLVGMLVDLGAEVVVLARDQVPATPIGTWRDRVGVVRGDVEDHDVVERMLGEYEVATGFHLAAQTLPDVALDNPRSTFEANIQGTWALLEAARRCPRVGQVVIASSDRVYGEPRALPFTEDMPYLATAPLDVSKACADLLAASYARSFGVPVAMVRCGNFLGPGDTNWDRLVPGTIRSLLSGRRPVVRANGRTMQDYLYVVDGALAYLRLAEALAERPELAGEAFQFSNERPVTVLEMVEMLQIGAGTHLDPDVQSGEGGETTHRYVSAAKAREILGWQPRHTVEEAVILSVRWYREYLGAGPEPGR